MKQPFSQPSTTPRNVGQDNSRKVKWVAFHWNTKEETWGIHTMSILNYESVSQQMNAEKMLCIYISGHYILTKYIFDFVFAVCLVVKSCSTLLRPNRLQSPISSVHGISPGKNTRVGCHFLLQGIVPTQKLNPHLLHWQADSSAVSHLGSSSYP